MIKMIKKALFKYHRQGHLAELIAAWTLRLKGYRILSRRYKTPVGEVDIIAAKGKVVVAIEVKYRQTFDRACEAITPRQCVRIERAFSLYLRRLKWKPSNIRFDVVLLSPYKWPRHIKNARII
jgi:putative endonuclease